MAHKDAFLGNLTVAEKRDPASSRSVLRARFTALASGTEEDILAELRDARLLWVESGEMRLTGVESIGNATYAQTWLVEVVVPVADVPPCSK